MGVLKFPEKRLTILAFVVLVLIWGSAFAVIKVGLGYSPPLLFAGMRTLLGGIALTGAAVVAGGKRFGIGDLPVVGLSALFNVVMFIGFQTLAVLHLPSGSAAVLIYLQPVMVGLMAWIFLGEGLPPVKIAGLVLGFAGVVAVSSGSFSGLLSPLGVVLGVLSGISWAAGTVYFKSVSGRGSTLWFVAGTFLMGGAVLLVSGLVFEEWSRIEWAPAFFASLGYTTFIGVALAWAIWLTLVGRGEASRVAAYIFVVPLISVVVGAVFLGEPLAPSLLVGAALIVSGIYLVNRRGAK